jgi:hypothetical protein
MMRGLDEVFICGKSYRRKGSQGLCCREAPRTEAEQSDSVAVEVHFCQQTPPEIRPGRVVYSRTPARQTSFAE